MADTAYICGAFAELRSDSDTPYIYQDVRFDGFRPLSLQRHIELMDIVSWRLRNRATGLAAKRIAEITEHMRSHKKDHSTRKGLLALVSKRKRLLKYLGNENHEKFVAISTELGIRGQK